MGNYKIKFTNTFEKSAKKFHRNQITHIEDAIDKIANDPEIGDLKKGDLANVRVYKFRVHHQQILLAYIFNEAINEIILLSLGSHENFYRDLKR